MTPWRGYASRPSGLEAARSEAEYSAALAHWEASYLLWQARKHIGFAYQELRRHQDPRWRSLPTNATARHLVGQARTELAMARRAVLAGRQAVAPANVEDLAHVG